MAIPNSYDILQAVIDATPDAIFVKDLEGRYVLVNEAFTRFLGRPAAEVVGKFDRELYPEETARQFVADDQLVLSTGRAQSFEGVAQSHTGLQAYLVTKGVYRDRHGAILGTYGISHDITELRHAHETLERTREALFQSQKMEAVGQLTGGLAHDFNNLLAVILGNMELLRIHLREDAHAQELIETVVRAALHGRDLTGDLLAFSRRRQLNPQPVALTPLIESTVRLLRRTLGAKITISTSASEETIVAVADIAALESALLNIALNARDAMPDGGTLTIRAAKTVVTESAAADDQPAPGAYAVLEIDDSGSGMTSDVLARVFEPFFTTKGNSEGTGLGLSMVYGFARQSGGAVTISSEPGRGTRVRLYLPLSEQEPKAAPDPAPAVDARGAAHTILVVEDEAAVRNTVRRQLEYLGYRVLLADTAEAALDTLHGDGAVDLLLSDVVLGSGMNGIDLAAAARARRPGLPVVLMSGYAAVAEAQQRMREVEAPFLPKPSTMSQLQGTISAALGDTS